MARDRTLAETVAAAPVETYNATREQELKRAKADATAWKHRHEQLLIELQAAEDRASLLMGIRDSPLKERNLKRVKGGGDATAVLVLSDWHMEEHVDPSTVNGLNEYTPDIARRRAKQVFQRALMLVEMWRGVAKIDELVLGLLGDFITGYIHEELVEGNAMSPTEALVAVMEMIHDGIRFLKKEGGFKRIIVPTCYGNHGRTTPKSRIATAAKNSYEWLMYKMMEGHYAADPQVTFKVGTSYHNWMSIRGWDCRFHHGDHIRYGGGVGGISIPVNKALAQWDKTTRASYDWFGHYHQFLESPRWVCNGSLIGYGPYALSIKAEYEEPSQCLSIVSEKRGRIVSQRVFAEDQILNRKTGARREELSVGGPAGPVRRGSRKS